MESENKRKWRGLKQGDSADKGTLNFGGHAPELWCDGGEAGFITRMIEESLSVKDQCFWFTSLVARKDNLAPVYQALKQVQATQVKTVEMAQGQKISRFVAWSFLDTEQMDFWRHNFWRK